jgi:hypothetical protein
MRPPYLRHSFLESGYGLHFATPPPTDVADLRHLAGNEPWRVLACALANLQQGRFDVSAGCRCLECLRDSAVLRGPLLRHS